MSITNTTSSSAPHNNNNISASATHSIVHRIAYLAFQKCKSTSNSLVIREAFEFFSSLIKVGSSLKSFADSEPCITAKSRFTFKAAQTFFDKYPRSFCNYLEMAVESYPLISEIVSSIVSGMQVTKVENPSVTLNCICTVLNVGESMKSFFPSCSAPLVKSKVTFDSIKTHCQANPKVFLDYVMDCVNSFRKSVGQDPLPQYTDAQAVFGGPPRPSSAPSSSNSEYRSLESRVSVSPRHSLVQQQQDLNQIDTVDQAPVSLLPQQQQQQQDDVARVCVKLFSKRPPADVGCKFYTRGGDLCKNNVSQLSLCGIHLRMFNANKH